MASTVSNTLAAAHPALPEKAVGSVAKADLLKAETETENRRLIGRAINRTRELAGLSLKEFAAAVDRDVRQVGRWIDGSERAQLDVLMAVRVLRPLVIIAFAEIAGEGVEVTTEIKVRRTA